MSVLLSIMGAGDKEGWTGEAGLREEAVWGLLRGGIPSPCWILWPRCDRQEGMGGHSGVYVRREHPCGAPTVDSACDVGVTACLAV